MSRLLLELPSSFKYLLLSITVLKLMGIVISALTGFPLRVPGLQYFIICTTLTASALSAGETGLRTLTPEILPENKT